MISNLEVIFLQGNCLYDNIPPSIFSNQSHIESFDVSNNQLKGVLSFSAFVNASSLKELDLSSNYNLEVETKSPSWVPAFQLMSLILDSCNINKKNNHVVPSFISTQFSLVVLDLSKNSIERSIPCYLLFNMSLKFPSLRSNKHDGSFLYCFAN